MHKNEKIYLAKVKQYDNYKTKYTYGRQNCINSKHHCDDMVLGIIICAYNTKKNQILYSAEYYIFEISIIITNCIMQEM